MQLFLDTTVNGAHRGTVRFELRRDVLWVHAAELKRLGFNLSTSEAEMLRIDSLASMTVDFDASTQTIRLTAPIASLSLPTTVLAANEPVSAVAASGGSGVLLNYDFYVMQAAGTAPALSAFTEARAFSGDAVLSQTSLSRVPLDADGRGAQHRRLDTTWSRSFQAEAVTLRVGDILTGSLPWTRTTRLGGVQLARNFALQPYRPTAPLPSYLGSAVLPSALELYVNGARQHMSQVPAGPFRLDGLPSLNASGSAQVVLTDVLGRTSAMTFPLYDVGKLLAEGLTDWSIEAGVVRQNYGLRSSDYGKDLVFSGIWRRGLTPSFTIEAHAEGTQALRMAGMGGVLQAGPLGLISGSLSHSQHAGQSGTQATVAYSWMHDGLSASMSTSHVSRDFRDAASLHGASHARSTARATIGYGAPGIGNLSASMVHLHGREQDKSRLASFNWLLPLGRSLSMSIGVARDLSRRDGRSVSLNLSWDLDATRGINLGVHREGNRTYASADARSSEPSDGGWSWRMAASSGGQDAGRAEIGHAGPYGRLSAGIGAVGKQNEGFLSASGSLLYMDGEVFASRRLDNSFAVVSTDGLAGVPVMLENRLVGKTDAHGKLLVAPLNSYQKNLLGIDPMQLPAAVRVDRTQVHAVPPDRGGAMVRFALPAPRAALVVLVDESASPLPAGTEVRRDGSADPLVVGYDGELYIEGLQPAGNGLTADTPGGPCRATFALPPSAPGIPRVGPLRCAGASAQS
ncbi:outer membrane usher protein [Variovorax sp. 3319]|nr:fimbria/pilus outer membrane usher protein [Variovorax sp. 3319]MDR6890685.1 outer membrane usher protein [Variovorax sp. 3319]